MIHHSDRGVHYACGDYQAELKAAGVMCSVRRKGDCWDNAVAERFFSTLLFELERDARWHDVHDVEREVQRVWRRALRRRSQRDCLTWARMARLTKRWLPPARIARPWPAQRFDAKTRGRSPAR